MIIAIAKRLIKKIIPSWMLRLYHRGIAFGTKFIYGNPGKDLTIIGFTGTNGKSSTVHMTGHILRAVGIKVAWISTATIRIGDREWLNDSKMTMPGHGAIQKFLRQAKKEGCTHAVVEVSSQGVDQSRDVGIPFDVAGFLNITPEHIEYHGSFDRYRDTKLDFFRHLGAHRYKKNGKLQNRSLVINIDDPNGYYFFSVGVEKYLGFTRTGKKFPGFTNFFAASDIHDSHNGLISFQVNHHPCELHLFGEYSIDNALAALAATYAIGVPLEKSTQTLASFPGVPGRMEVITKKPFTVIVDYAPEPASMNALYETVEKMEHHRIIHVFGSAGGGRDVARRPILGSLVGLHADIAIITNEDPYDDDPMKIMNDVAEGVRKEGKLTERETFFIVPERRAAIALAVSKASEGDVVLITGKACEQWIMGKNGSKIPWDDRTVTREELARIEVFPQ